MGKKEAIPSGKVQDLLLEDVKKAEQEKSAADHQVRSNPSMECHSSYTFWLVNYVLLATNFVLYVGVI